MSQLRAPRLAGVAGGVGTTTLATAVHGYDRGRAVDRGVEILVCRSTGDSLHAAATVLAGLASAGHPRPVLAVVADQPTPLRAPLRARLRMIEPQASGLVRVPYVTHWRDLTDPLTEAARLSEWPADQLPRALRGYGEALARLAEAVLRSGLLTSAQPGGPRPGVSGTGPHRAVHTTGPNPVVTGTGPYRAVSGTGPYPAVTGTGPHRAVTGTGPRPAVTGTGPRPVAIDTGPRPAVTGTGPSSAVTGTGPQRAVTGTGPRGPVHRTGPWPAVPVDGRPAPITRRPLVEPLPLTAVTGGA
jgi:hypothetical protein